MHDEKDQLKKEYGRVAEQERQKAAKKKRIEAIFIAIAVLVGFAFVFMFASSIMGGSGSNDDGGNIHERMRQMHGMIPTGKGIA